MGQSRFAACFQLLLRLYYLHSTQYLLPRGERAMMDEANQQSQPELVCSSRIEEPTNAAVPRRHGGLAASKREAEVDCSLLVLTSI